MQNVNAILAWTKINHYDIAHCISRTKNSLKFPYTKSIKIREYYVLCGIWYLMSIPAEIVLKFQMTIMMDWLAELFFLLDWALFNGFQHFQKNIIFTTVIISYLMCTCHEITEIYTTYYPPITLFWMYCLIWIKSKQIMCILLLICHQFLLISVIHTKYHMVHLLFYLCDLHIAVVTELFLIYLYIYIYFIYLHTKSYSTRLWEDYIHCERSIITHSKFSK